MKKFILPIAFTALLLTGCKKEADVIPTPEIQQQEETEQKEPVVKILDTYQPPKKTEEITEEDAPTVSENSDIQEAQAEPKYEEYAFTSLDNKKYTCTLYDDGKLIVKHKDEEFTEKLDSQTYYRVIKVMDYMINHRTEFIQLAKNTEIPENEVDPEGWIGDMLYAMARGKEQINDDTTYDRYGFETLMELEAIIKNREDSPLADGTVSDNEVEETKDAKINQVYQYEMHIGSEWLQTFSPVDGVVSAETMKNYLIANTAQDLNSGKTLKDVIDINITDDCSYYLYVNGSVKFSAKDVIAAVQGDTVYIAGNIKFQAYSTDTSGGLERTIIIVPVEKSVTKSVNNMTIKLD